MKTVLRLARSVALCILTSFSVAQAATLTLEEFSATLQPNGSTVRISWRIPEIDGFLTFADVAISRSDSPDTPATSRTLIEPYDLTFVQQRPSNYIDDNPPKTGKTYYYWIHVGSPMTFLYLCLDGDSGRRTILSHSCLGPVSVYVGSTPPALSPPKNLKASTDGHPYKFALSWDPVEGAEKYKVEYSSDGSTFTKFPGGDGIASTSCSGTWSFTSGSGTIPRYYRVIALAGGAESAPSEPAYWNYVTEAFPSTVQAVSVDRSTGSLKISWQGDANQLPAGLWCAVYRYTDASLPQSGRVKVGETTEAEILDTGFGTIPGVGSVYYRVEPCFGVYGPSSPLETRRRFGVFVGVDSYDDGWCEERTYCVSTARGIASGYGAPFGRSFVHCGTDATLSGIRAAFEACSTEARPGDLFAYFHASHGILDQNDNYMGPALYAKGSTLPPSELSSLLNGFREGVSTAIILDSCYSGAMRSSVSLAHPADVGWILSTGSKVESLSSDGMSFSSAGLLSTGWRHGCADANADGFVTFAELGAYAKSWSESAFDIFGLDAGVFSGGVLEMMTAGPVGGQSCSELPPIGPVSVRDKDVSVTLTWEPVPTATRYIVYRRRQGEPWGLHGASVAECRYDDLDVGEENVVYEFAVKPKNDDYIGRARVVSGSYEIKDELTDYIAAHWSPGDPDSPYNPDGSIDFSKLKMDHDHDGHTLYDEYVAGTNPRDPKDVFLTRIELTDGTCRITWSPDLGDRRRYVVQGTDVLNGEWRTSDPDCRFFRATVELK